MSEGIRAACGCVNRAHLIFCLTYENKTRSSPYKRTRIHMDLDLKLKHRLTFCGYGVGWTRHERTMRCAERVLSECCVGATKPPAACFDIDETMFKPS